VGAINGASLKYGVPMAFLSAILLPMVGGIAEFAAAVQFAMKDKMDIAIGVAIGSSTQFALLVIPTCVLVGAMIGQPLDLDFGVFESATLLLVVLVVNANVQDGTSNWLKGLMLLIAYATLSVSIFYHTFDDNPDAGKTLSPSPAAAAL
jgi:Ca2+:H+ antiporter